MSTKKEGYVRSINCTCYIQLSESLKVHYFMAVKQNFVRSCELFPFLSRCFFGRVIEPPQSLDDMLASYYLLPYTNTVLHS